LDFKYNRFDIATRSNLLVSVPARELKYRQGGLVFHGNLARRSRIVIGTRHGNRVRVFMVGQGIGDNTGNRVRFLISVQLAF
jgi:hypothetical protein